MKPFHFAFASMAAGLLLNGSTQGQTTSGMVPIDITGRFGSTTPTTLFSAPNATYEAKFLAPADAAGSSTLKTYAFNYTLNGAGVPVAQSTFMESNGINAIGGNKNLHTSELSFEVSYRNFSSRAIFFLSGPGWIGTNPNASFKSYFIPGTYALPGTPGIPNHGELYSPGLIPPGDYGTPVSLADNRITIGSPVPEPSTLGLLGLGGLALLTGTVLRGRGFRT